MLAACQSGIGGKQNNSNRSGTVRPAAIDSGVRAPKCAGHINASWWPLACDIGQECAGSRLILAGRARSKDIPLEAETPPRPPKKTGTVQEATARPHEDVCFVAQAQTFNPGGANVADGPSSSHPRIAQRTPWLAGMNGLRFYSFISSICASSVGVGVKPRARTVFILSVAWNIVGCSTGRSAGFAPLRILST